MAHSVFFCPHLGHHFEAFWPQGLSLEATAPHSLSVKVGIESPTFWINCLIHILKHQGCLLIERTCMTELRAKLAAFFYRILLFLERLTDRQIWSFIHLSSLASILSKWYKWAYNFKEINWQHLFPTVKIKLQTVKV